MCDVRSTVDTEKLNVTHILLNENDLFNVIVSHMTKRHARTRLDEFNCKRTKIRTVLTSTRERPQDHQSRGRHEQAGRAAVAAGDDGAARRGADGLAVQQGAGVGRAGCRPAVEEPGQGPEARRLPRRAARRDVREADRAHARRPDVRHAGPERHHPARPQEPGRPVLLRRVRARDQQPGDQPGLHGAERPRRPAGEAARPGRRQGGTPGARRGLPDRPEVRHAAGGGARARHRPPGHDADGRREHPRRDPVPVDAAAGVKAACRLASAAKRRLNHSLGREP